MRILFVKKTRFVVHLSTYMIVILANGQILRPGGALDSYAQFLYLDNPETNYITRQIVYQDTLKTSLWAQFKPLRDQKLAFFDPEFSLYHNSTHSQSVNDGPVWKGKGLAAELNIGAYGRMGNLHYSFVPVLFYVQNADFTLPLPTGGNNEFNYQFSAMGRIDYVQRYGNGAYIKFHTGQSEIRFLKKNFTLAASTQNFTLGPATVNPILLSQQGPGFPHVEVGIPNFIDLRWKQKHLGKVKTNLYYGLLAESDYFDTNPNNDHRYFTALSFSYTLPTIDWIRIGANRVFYQDLTKFKFRDLGRTFFYFSNFDNVVVNNSGDVINDFFDQMGSVFLEWLLRPSKFRAYIEYAKNDFNGSQRDFLVDTDHSRGYTVGFDKMFESKKGQLMVTFEHTNLSRSKSFLYRATPPFYSHTQVHQGYTNDGQLLGAGIGPGSSSNYLSFSHFSEKGLLKFAFQRIQFNDDYILENPPVGNNINDVRYSEYSLQSNITRFKDNWMFSVDVWMSYRFNVDFQLKNDKLNSYIAFSSKLLLK